MGTLFTRNPFIIQNCGAFSTHQHHSCCICWCSWPVSFNPISNVRLCLSSHSLSLMLELQPELQVQSQTYKMSVTQITSSQVMGSGYSCSEWMGNASSPVFVQRTWLWYMHDPWSRQMRGLWGTHVWLWTMGAMSRSVLGTNASQISSWLHDLTCIMCPVVRTETITRHGWDYILTEWHDPPTLEIEVNIGSRCFL